MSVRCIHMQYLCFESAHTHIHTERERERERVREREGGGEEEMERERESVGGGGRRENFEFITEAMWQLNVCIHVYTYMHSCYSFILP